MTNQPSTRAAYYQALFTVESILRDLHRIQRHTTEPELLRELRRTRDVCAEAVLTLDECLSPKPPRQ